MPAVAVDDTLGPRVFTLTRADLVRYAAASGDHNPIHTDEDVAAAVGLPGVIAHGMLTLGLVATALADWFPGATVRDLAAKFTHPVVVPAGAGAEIVVTARVTAVEDPDSVAVALEVTCGGQRVLGRPRAVLRTGGAAGG